MKLLIVILFHNIYAMWSIINLYNNVASTPLNEKWWFDDKYDILVDRWYILLG